MGTCGCCDFQGDFKFDGPNGFEYVISIYPGCEYCGLEAGIILNKIDMKDQEMWGVEDIPSLELPDGMRFISVLDLSILNGKMLEYFKGCNDDLKKDDDPESLLSFMFEDGLKENFIGSVDASFAQWKKDCNEE